MFEYENSLLIVDELIYDPMLPNQIVVRINNDYFKINRAEAHKPINESAMHPYKRTVNTKWSRGVNGMEFLMVGTMPRGGFKVELGRSITAEEFKKLCARFNLTNEDISSEFEDEIGGVYGKYAKNFKSLQIRVPSDQVIPLESELRNKGIQAGNVACGRVNIRIDWDGFREGLEEKQPEERSPEFILLRKNKNFANVLKS